MFSYSFPSAFCSFALGLLSVVLFRRIIRQKASRQYPPGPKPLPIVGNMFDMPRTDLGPGFAELSRRYGAQYSSLTRPPTLNTSFVLYRRSGLCRRAGSNQKILILGSYEAAEEILDKRSATTSDRPDSAMLRLCGLQWFFPFMPYGQAWRRRRRAFHQSFDAQVITQYQPVQTFHIHRLIRNLLHSPKRFEEHVKFSLAAMALQIAYGIKLCSVHEKPYTMIERLVDMLDDISVPGKYIVEAIPILQKLPSWIPGTSFKTHTAAVKADAEYIMTRLYAMPAALAGNDPAPGTTASLITHILAARPRAADGDELAELEELCKSTAASAYLTSVETTNTMTQAFFVLIALYPHVRQKAQEEIDTVVGPNHLPTFDDIASLPYLHALIKELLRWHSPVPSGIPHKTTSDEEYKGYFIPEGTVVFANILSLSRDPKEYVDPENFMPERFLSRAAHDRTPMDPRQFVFGHGRRICAGRFFADETLALLCASVLHLFDIKPSVDGSGVPQKIEYKVMSDNIVSHPVLYDFVITPRSQGAENLILSMDVGST